MSDKIELEWQWPKFQQLPKKIGMYIVCLEDDRVVPMEWISHGLRFSYEKQVSTETFRWTSVLVKVKKWAEMPKA